jgi:hypothetical protein
MQLVLVGQAAVSASEAEDQAPELAPLTTIPPVVRARRSFDPVQRLLDARKASLAAVRHSSSPRNLRTRDRAFLTFD